MRLFKGDVIVFAFSQSQRRETNFLLQMTFRERLAVCMPREEIYCGAMMPQQRFFPLRSGAEDRLTEKNNDEIQVDSAVWNIQEKKGNYFLPINLTSSVTRD